MKKSLKSILALAMAAGMSLSVLCMPASAEFVTDKKGKTYYTNDAGKKVTGWQTIDGKKYYFASNGVMKTGWLTMKSGKKYYLGKDGAMVTGWKTISKKKYYFDPETGVAATGDASIGKKLYQFNSEGEFIKQYKNTAVWIGNKLYGVDKNGDPVKGKMMDVDFGNGRKTSYYFGADGCSVSIKKVLNGITYVFDSKDGLLESYYQLVVGTLKEIVRNDVLTLDATASEFMLDSERSALGYKTNYYVTVRNNTNSKVKVTLYGTFYDKNGRKVDTVKFTMTINPYSSTRYEDYTYVNGIAKEIKFEDISIT